jgi:hypothetical protein
MRLKTKIFFAILGNLFSLQLLAQQEGVIQTQPSKNRPSYCYDSWVLLDPDIPLAEKLEDIRALELSAELGDSLSQHIIGSFYRLGDKHPAKIFPEDIVKAKKYLSNAAIHGNLPAMAGMAELELANKNNKDAMLWSQVFAYYSKEEQQEQKGVSNLAYQAFLLKRVFDAARKESGNNFDKSFLEDFNSFFVNYDTEIRANKKRVLTSAEIEKYKACDHGNEKSTPDNTKVLNADKIRGNAETSSSLRSPGFAFYLVGINAQGVVIKVMTVDSLPNETYAKALTGVAKTLEFNKTPGLELRYAYIPLSFDDESIRIKKTRSNSTPHRQKIRAGDQAQ